MTTSLSTPELSVLKEISAYGCVHDATPRDVVPSLIERRLLTHWHAESGTASLTDTGYAQIGLYFDSAGREVTGQGVLGVPRVHVFDSGPAASFAAERREMCDGDIFYAPADQVIGLVVAGGRARSLTFPTVNLPALSLVELVNQHGPHYAPVLRRIHLPTPQDLAAFAADLPQHRRDRPPALAWAYHDEYYCPRCIRIVADMLLHTGDPRENADAAWYYTCALRQLLPEEVESCEDSAEFPAPIYDRQTLIWQVNGSDDTGHTYWCASCVAPLAPDNPSPVPSSAASQEGTDPR